MSGERLLHVSLGTSTSTSWRCRLWQQVIDIPYPGDDMDKSMSKCPHRWLDTAITNQGIFVVYQTCFNGAALRSDHCIKSAQRLSTWPWACLHDWCDWCQGFRDIVNELQWHMDRTTYTADSNLLTVHWTSGIRQKLYTLPGMTNTQKRLNTTSLL